MPKPADFSRNNVLVKNTAKRVSQITTNIANQVIEVGTPYVITVYADTDIVEWMRGFYANFEVPAGAQTSGSWNMYVYAHGMCILKLSAAYNKAILYTMNEPGIDTTITPSVVTDFLAVVQNGIYFDEDNCFSISICNNTDAQITINGLFYHMLQGEVIA